MKEFHRILTEGNFGDVSLGDSIGKLLQVLGEPEDTSIKKRKYDLQIYKYGIFEFVLAYTDDKTDRFITSVNILFHQMKNGRNVPVPLLSDDWFPDGSTMPNEFEHYLVEQKLDWIKDRDYVDEECEYYSIGLSHVLFTINSDDWPRGLNKICISSKNA